MRRFCGRKSRWRSRHWPKRNGYYSTVTTSSPATTLILSLSPLHSILPLILPPLNLTLNVLIKLNLPAQPRAHSRFIHTPALPTPPRSGAYSPLSPYLTPSTPPLSLSLHSHLISLHQHSHLILSATPTSSLPPLPSHLSLHPSTDLSISFAEGTQISVSRFESRLGLLKVQLVTGGDVASCILLNL